MINVGSARQRVWLPLWQLPGRLNLILTLTKRELTARYKGSLLGLLWAILTPVVMIAIFTLIFAGIFHAKFGNSNSRWDYALYLFCGLLPWNAFQEAAQLSATTIVSHANLVKRVVFPVETLPVAQSLAALANQLFGTIALLIAIVVINRELHITLLYLPLLLFIQLPAMLGAGWLLASLGVFVRDIVQGVGLVLTAWLYLTPIIYPESLIPSEYRAIVNLNPFTGLVRCYRRIMLEGAPPDGRALVYFSAFSMILLLVGYWWFAKSRKNFADVI
jgi:lipopolysaccharide transport system permease protein